MRQVPQDPLSIDPAAHIGLPATWIDDAHNSMDTQTRKKLIQEHLDVVRRLETQDSADPNPLGWPPDGYYFLWHLVVGMLLGIVGATTSLIFNIVGSILVGQHPLRLIQVFLTFPMGQRALDSDDGPVLFVGCILFLSTGALYGAAFHLVMSLFFGQATTTKRIVIASLLGLGLWVINFYFVLSWLQPLLLGGSWIIRLVPFWVAALTHLVFAWTVLACDFWGTFDRRLPS